MRSAPVRSGYVRSAAAEAVTLAPWTEPPVDVDVVVMAVEGMEASGTELTESTVGDVADSVTVAVGSGGVQRYVVDPPGVVTVTLVRPCSRCGAVTVSAVGLVTE